MNWINMQRRMGKTTMLIYASYVTGAPIIVTSVSRKTCVLDTAKKLNLNVQVYTTNEWMTKFAGRKPNAQVMIDEAQDFIEEALNRQLNANVIAVTMTLPCVERSE